MQGTMTLEEFLQQYQDALIDLEECKERLKELDYPQRGNRIVTGAHSGISNQPEEHAIVRDQLERKIKTLESVIPHKKRQIEKFLNLLKQRQSRLLRKKYVEGLNSLELAAWMHVQPKSANAAVKFALEEARSIYDRIYSQHKGKNAV